MQMEVQQRLHEQLEVRFLNISAYWLNNLNIYDDYLIFYILYHSK